MPELPEVETARRLAERELVGRRIEQVEVADDRVVYDRAPPEAVQATLMGRTVAGARRKGKYLWLVLDRPPHPHQRPPLIKVLPHPPQHSRRQKVHMNIGQPRHPKPPRGVDTQLCGGRNGAV